MSPSFQTVKSAAAGDCAFYPDKKKSSGALNNGQKSCKIIRPAGHWRDEVSTLVKQISV
ncbi:hypothetical protein ELI_0343 [Eubacterium callanderi]|uniref:Uncharacterized protein n=1 Tax=Eubacterium callanderi TaxID=53442 RepID=E3GI77_9FIRM|nr:hypothetical protein ELI_0343 [Eubacterium callanderi]